MSQVCVIVAAAGKSERFGSDEKKTFVKIDGRPVFLRTLEQFINRDDVCQTILAVAPDDMAAMKSQYGANLGFLGVLLVEGGDRRSESVRAALKAVSPKAEFVAVHDAARPCIAADRIDAVFTEAKKSGAAILARPLTGTIKRVSSAMVIDETVPREGLYEAQTPQVFRRELLIEAYEKLPLSDAGATDDAQVVERIGFPIAVVPDVGTNIKITTKGDIALAAAILQSRPSRPAHKLGAFEEAQW